MAMQRSGTQIPIHNLTHANAFADLGGLTWEPIQDLIDFSETSVEEEIGDFEIEDPAILVESFTRDPSVGDRMLPDLGRNMNFAGFTREYFEPYILPEVGRRFCKAEKQLGNFVELRQLIFQHQMVKMANAWMI